MKKNYILFTCSICEAGKQLTEIVKVMKISGAPSDLFCEQHIMTENLHCRHVHRSEHVCKFFIFISFQEIRHRLKCLHEINFVLYITFSIHIFISQWMVLNWMADFVGTFFRYPSILGMVFYKSAHDPSYQQVLISVLMSGNHI